MDVCVPDGGADGGGTLARTRRGLICVVLSKHRGGDLGPAMVILGCVVDVGSGLGNALASGGGRTTSVLASVQCAAVSCCCLSQYSTALVVLSFSLVAWTSLKQTTVRSIPLLPSPCCAWRCDAMSAAIDSDPHPDPNSHHHHYHHPLSRLPRTRSPQYNHSVEQAPLHPLRSQSPLHPQWLTSPATVQLPHHTHGLCMA